MKYWVGVLFLGLILSGCKEDTCQSNLFGSWHSVQHPSSNHIIIESVQFYKGDSLAENYKEINGLDTLSIQGHGSFYITDDCSELFFRSTTKWGDGDTVGKYDVLSLKVSSFIFRSKKLSGCDSCTVVLNK